MIFAQKIAGAHRERLVVESDWKWLVWFKEPLYRPAMTIIAVLGWSKLVWSDHLTDCPKSGVAVGDNDEITFVHIHAETGSLGDVAVIAVRARIKFVPFGKNRVIAVVWRLIDASAPAEHDVVAVDCSVKDVVLGARPPERHLKDLPASHVERRPRPR